MSWFSRSKPLEPSDEIRKAMEVLNSGKGGTLVKEPYKVRVRQRINGPYSDPKEPHNYTVTEVRPTTGYDVGNLYETHVDIPVEELLTQLLRVAIRAGYEVHLHTGGPQLSISKPHKRA